MRIQINTPQISYDKRFMFIVNPEGSGNVKATAKSMLPLAECANLPDHLTRRILSDLDLGAASRLFPYTHMRLQPVMANQTLIAENYAGSLFVLFGRLNIRRDPKCIKELGVYVYVDFRLLLEDSTNHSRCCFNCAAVDMLDGSYDYE